MRRLVSMLCVVSLAACGGGSARTALPQPVVDGAASSSQRSDGTAAGIRLSTSSLAFSATGWSATKVVATTWTDDSRKAAVSSDPSVATVTPPYQLAAWSAPGAYRAAYWITPVGAGTATITFSDHGGVESAQLTVTVVAPPTGTLYVAGPSEVDAFPAAANGPTMPQRTLTGFYSMSSPPTRNSGSVGGVTTAPDGTTYVLQNLRTASHGECMAIPEPASANGSGDAANRFSCSGSRGYAAASGPFGEVDILVLGYGGGPVVQRFSGSGRTSLTAAGTGPAGLATDTAGNLFVSTVTNTSMVAGQVLEYAAGAVDGAAPMRTITAPAGGYFGSVAVARDGTVYAVFVVDDYVAGSSTSSIYAYATGATSPTRRLGPFPNDEIDALTCDYGGELYAAFTSLISQGSRVDVYAAGADAGATPVRTLPNPIPASSVGGTNIVGISLSPPDAPPAEQVLSRRRR